MSTKGDTAAARRNRGQFTRQDIGRLSKLTPEALAEIAARCPDAAERSAALHLLARHYPAGDPDFTRLLLERLGAEKALYTRIEICRILEQGTPAVARLMCRYLGRIGGNQHAKVPERISLKKSYPLPRDIVARMLGRMDIGILPLLLKYLASVKREQAAETIDAIGYLCARNPTAAQRSCVEALRAILTRFPGDELIAWKTARCLSVIPLPESAALLECIRESCGHETLRAECDKSLRTLLKRHDPANGLIGPPEPECGGSTGLTEQRGP